MKNLDMDKKEFTNKEVIKIVNYIVDNLVLDVEKTGCSECIELLKKKQELVKENIGDYMFDGEELLKFSQRCENC